MIAVIQRVSRASVEVEGHPVGRIEDGLLVLLGVAKGDGETDCRFLAEKLMTLRIFGDAAGKMNRSLTEVGGAILLVSQFTLLGNTRNGRRPSFDEAAPSDEAKKWYERLAEELNARGISLVFDSFAGLLVAAARGVRVETGIFGAHMKVELLNDGPVTFVLDSRDGMVTAS